MNYENTTYEVAGVMRCCIASLREWVNEHLTDKTEEGTEVLCKYKSNPVDSGFVLRGSVWRVRAFLDQDGLSAQEEK